MGIIKEAFSLAASDADILQAPSRLAAIPKAGVLNLEITARIADASNFWTITLQLPGGEIPFEDLIVPANGFSTVNDIMHSDTQLTFRIPVAAGGHVLFQATETGASVLYTIVTLEF